MPAPIKLLLLGLNFPPEIISTGKYNGEMVQYLSARGYDVCVITAPPYYPQWKILPDYSGWKYRRDKVGEVDVWRCPLWVPRRVTGLRRILHLLSFSLSSIPVMLGQVFWKPDVVLCVIPTFFSAPIAWLAARLCGAKSWLHIHDFELDAAFRLGMLPGRRLLQPVAQIFERLVIARFDRLSTISENMLALAIHKGAKKDRVCLLPNWVDTASIYPLREENALKAELEIDSTRRIILYHGNMGHKQGLETVIDAARLLKDSPEILFLLCGDGSARPELERRAENLSNLTFIPLQPDDKLNLLVNLADAQVLPQRKDAADLVMPSKLTTMLASGKPVIVCAAPGTQLWMIASQVGLAVPPEEPRILADAIVRLVNDPKESSRLGQLGRDYACQYFDRKVILSQFQSELERLLRE